MMNEEENIEKQEGNGVLPCVSTRLCFHFCKYLSITESEQNRLKVKDPHFCERYNKQVKHNGMYPRLPMLNECAYFGKVCKWCKSTKTHYDYVSIEGVEIWQCNDCKQEFLWDF